jgi:hypothetical protein
MRATTVVMSILAALAISTPPGAHEGHAHRVMGVVKAVDSAHVEVEAKEGGRVSVLLTPATKYFRGRVPSTAADLRVGERIVVTVVEEQGRKSATKVLLATAGGKPTSDSR